MDQARHYRSVESDELGTRFFNEALRALRALERTPLAGSPHAGELAGIPGLRSWPVPRFPVRWCYFSLVGELDMVRLLVDGRDLPAELTTEATAPE